jgi:hypothetical protein
MPGAAFSGSSSLTPSQLRSTVSEEALIGWIASGIDFSKIVSSLPSMRTLTVVSACALGATTMIRRRTAQHAVNSFFIALAPFREGDRLCGSEGGLLTYEPPVAPSRPRPVAVAYDVRGS